MGKVIAFQPGARAAPTREGALRRDAEILFFLGVRYERMDDACYDQKRASGPDSCGAPPTRGKRRRRARA
ncbi:hypothetical protein [Methylocystis sp.]|jgi:hypothetical protein|uniref:hypothetical protein n=1 Tax=Methylocystis sp. TaxID=1911079 RepID=UPI003D0F005A